jgi:hypothetical protein
MSIKKFQMKDLLEQVATNEAKKSEINEEETVEEDMEEEVVLEKADDEEENGKKEFFKSKKSKKEDGDDGDDDDDDDEDDKEDKKDKKNMKEETSAASSLKPGARSISDPKSKIGMMQAVMGQMHQMSKGDLSHWFTSTMSQFGPGKDYGVGDKSGSNQSSIDMKSGSGPKTKDAMPKLSVKEDVEEMFANSDLSEEFKENAATLFEAAVHARTLVEIARLEEEYEEAFAESVEEITDELTSKLDSYLEYVTEQWMEDNEVAIESTLRNELMEEFIDGMKGLFAEHYIDVPQEKIDVIEALAEKVEILEAALDESIDENVELKRNMAEVEKDDILESLCDGLALSQVEKFKALAEGIDFDGDLETYGKKLAFVKESYFNVKKPVVSTNIEEETFEGEVTSINSASIDPAVNRYVQAITRNVKK